ncbi:hypothetical protein A3A67_02280 [Candidatus Peribacteria bacterium RIFCSPLOWO2_01_FULL_51_18]|nr:MAG: hypothetical protein A3C52_01845 [Candidatus Peribacteria bacterium RIFCSPHIGHO2_02_FULL_51_15]OGJ66407.1 MAG: hypothetical protein A3A67_02280 [Candidatus Peribacteria bacterium RIFCSPLOWO2_01_FULL_51_18]OGJ69465.1 MAG: hypothetical protein A3J34_03300 [Candidatus Peribacteria bacterium RIFCSPLOWO2_02_FULL_51_10]
MNLKQFFKTAVDYSIDHDPRGRKQVEKLLGKQAKRFNEAKEKDREMMDEERNWNPYSDSRIISGTGEEEFSRLAVGIDMETAEFLLIDNLRKNGEKIDGALIHHPEGRALADLEKSMSLQIDVLAQTGVPVNHSESLLRPRMDKIWRSIHADNLFRAERAAGLLKIPAVCCHTVTDNLVWSFMQKNFCKKEFDDLGEIINALLDVPEYKAYAKRGNPPIIANGGKSNRPGRVFATEFTGGTNGPEEFFEAQSRAGVGTILSMHVPEKSLEEAKKHHLNIIQCSHIAADSLGINLLLDHMKKKDPKLSFFELSGFIRVERKKW